MVGQDMAGHGKEVGGEENDNNDNDNDNDNNDEMNK